MFTGGVDLDLGRERRGERKGKWEGERDAGERKINGVTVSMVGPCMGSSGAGVEEGSPNDSKSNNDVRFISANKIVSSRQIIRVKKKMNG